MNTLEERDQYIRKLSNDIAELQSKNQELTAQVTMANTEKAKRTAAESAAAAQTPFSFVESRNEIARMEEALGSGLSAAQVSALVISEMEETRLRRDLAVKELAEQTAELAQAKSQAAAAKMENADLRERLFQETTVASTALRELEIIQQRVEISFTAAQLAGYISQAIDSFNCEANAGDLSVTYVINNMEVTFKASLTKNATGEMTIAAPSLSGGEESLSTIKFNISAIPKEDEAK